LQQLLLNIHVKELLDVSFNYSWLLMKKLVKAPIILLTILFFLGVLEKVVLCIEDKATGRKLERFVWEIDFDMTASPALSATSSRVLTEPRNQEELEDALRQVLLKISVSDSLLPPQKRKDVSKFPVQSAILLTMQPSALISITSISMKFSVCTHQHSLPRLLRHVAHKRLDS
jgi:hypothetical protein